jgi:flagellar operon protein (TIGR03826 family)
MEDFRNCPVCGKIFVRKTRNLCPACVAEEEKDFDVVRKYLYAHPKANIVEVAEQTTVSEETILNFLKEGRLKAQGMSTMLSCKLCGAPIGMGDYCESCLNSLNQKFSSPKSSAQARKDTSKNSRTMFTREKE